jgi:hypothetical protein
MQNILLFMRVFLQILRENMKNHSSGKMGNCIELVRGCGVRIRMLAPTTGVIGFCDFATYHFYYLFRELSENMKKTPETIFAFFGQFDSH